MEGMTAKPKPNKRDVILNAMLDVVAERGFHEAPMSLISERSGASASVIYHHFASKEAIIPQTQPPQTQPPTDSNSHRLKLPQTQPPTDSTPHRLNLPQTQLPTDSSSHRLNPAQTQPPTDSSPHRLVLPQTRHPERSASQIVRVTRRLWRGVEGPRHCLFTHAARSFSTTEAANRIFSCTSADLRLMRGRGLPSGLEGLG
jgi:hypothetical protein